MLTRRRFLLAAGAAPAAVLAAPTLAQAAVNPGAKPVIYSRDEAAISGYDPVAYFTQAKAIPGSPEHQATWKDATWQFSTAEHKAMFEADPKAFAPQYGGYCAYAAALNYTAPTDPEVFSLHDGKLYLNFSRNVRRIWEMDKVNYIARADENWPGPLFA